MLNFKGLVAIALFGLSFAAAAAPASTSVSSPTASPGATADVVVTFTNSTPPNALAAGFEFRLTFDSTKLTAGMPTSTITGLFCAQGAPGVINCLGVDPKDTLPVSGAVAFPMTVDPMASGTSPLALSDFTWSDSVLNEFGPFDPPDGVFTIQIGPTIIFVDGFE